MTGKLDPTVRGHQPAGHKRWERAAQWAALKPDSVAGKTYLSRREAAIDVAANEGQKPWLLFRPGRTWYGEPEEFYLYQCCSTECAILQLQLELGVVGLEELHQTVLQVGRSSVYMVQRPTDSKRRGKCKACGKNVV